MALFAIFYGTENQLIKQRQEKNTKTYFIQKQHLNIKHGESSQGEFRVSQEQFILQPVH